MQLYVITMMSVKWAHENIILCHYCHCIHTDKKDHVVTIVSDKKHG